MKEFVLGNSVWKRLSNLKRQQRSKQIALAQVSNWYEFQMSSEEILLKESSLSSSIKENLSTSERFQKEIVSIWIKV